MAAYGAMKTFKGGRPGPYQPPAAEQEQDDAEAEAGAGWKGAGDDAGRQVYVGNLPYKMAWQDLKDHFKQVGNVENARILTDDGTDWGRSRGVGIVRFKTEAEAQAAITRLNGSELLGRALAVDAWTGSSGKWKQEKTEKGSGKGKTAVAENGQEMRPGDWLCPACGDLQFARNAVCRRCGAAPQAAGKGGAGKGAGKSGGKGFGTKSQEVHGEHLVYVGNLAYEVKWQDLKDHMKQAGNVEFCRVLTEDGTEYGRSKGSGCVRYGSEAEVEQAISMLAETELMGRNILVDHWTRNPKSAIYSL